MRRILLLLVILNSFYIMAVEREPDGLDCYNVVWDTPSRNALESMPCGAGDIGMNVWVDEWDLLVYLSRSGTRRIDSFRSWGRLQHIFVFPTFFKDPLTSDGY